MRRNLILSIAAIVATAILSMVALPARAEPTEETIRAFSVWESHGSFYVPGPEISTFSATLIGRLYVDTDKGPVDAGMLSCPATVHIKNADQTQEGSAICAITTKDGGQVFAELACTGVYMVGCSGEAKITGGTGRFKGVTGDGKFTIRSDLASESGGAINGQMMNGQMMNGQAMNGQMMNGQQMPDLPMPNLRMPNLPMMGSMMAGTQVGGILFFKELHYKVP